MLRNPRLRLAALATLALIVVVGLVSFAFLHNQPATPSHSAPVIQKTYFVSPTGSDSNNGLSATTPFKTLVHARDVVRTLAPHLKGDIIMNLLDGTYQLSSTLTFTSDDSGTNGHNIIYQAANYGTPSAAHPIISGGQQITGWTLADSSKNIWKASVSPTLQTRQLYVNGVRATRARSTSGIPGTVKLTSTGYTTTDTSLQHWRDPSTLEFVYTGATSGAKWKESRCGVASITGTSTSTTITMQHDCWYYGLNSSVQQDVTSPTYLENAYELLDQPGEWYLDHNASTLYYIPVSRETLTTATVIAPTLETLIGGSGTLDRPIHNIQFKGLTFAYATWLEPSSGNGFIEIQANAYASASGTILPNGNLSFQTVHDLRFERNIFTHLGNAGLRLWNGSQNNTIIGNIFTDISSSGVIIGDINNPLRSDPRQIDSGNQLLDNYVHDIAAEYHGGIGLFAGYVANTLISHNQINNVPYTAISIGWGWGQRSNAHDNHITNNLIFNHMQLLADGGGIYNLSPQGTSLANGMLISGNVVHDQANDYNAIYTDEGSQYITIQNNVLYNVPKDWGGCTSPGEPSGYQVFQNNFWQEAVGFCQTPSILTVQNNTDINDAKDCHANAACQAIVNAAGLEPAYRNLLTQK